MSANMQELQSEASIIYKNNDGAYCAVCKALLKPVYENNGYSPPDPTHFEIVGYGQCSHPDYE